MKIIIIGPGSMGILFGGYFAKNGHDVTFIDHNKERAKNLKNKGIIVENINSKQSINIKITDNPEEIKNPELILICVKAYSTISACNSIKQIAANSQTLILTLQNGIGNIENLSNVFDKNQIIGGVTSEGANTLKEGHIIHAGAGETFIGEINGEKTERIGKIVRIFNNCGFKTFITDKIQSHIWSKLVINAAINPLAAIFNVKNGELFKSELMSIVKLITEEAENVIRAKEIETIYPDVFLRVKEVCEKTKENINSMLQDIRNNKKTEVDFINGTIVNEGKKLEIPTPINESLLNIIHALERAV